MFRSHIRLLDSESLRELRVFEGYEGVALRVHFSPDGQSLVAVTGHPRSDWVGEHTRLHVWSTKAIASEHFMRDSPRRGDFMATAVSPDGKLLATNREAVELYEFPSLRLRETLPFGIRERGAIRFSPDGQIIAVGGDDGAIHLWDLRRSKESATLRSDGHAVLSLAFSTDGTRLAAGLGGSSRIDLWHLPSGRRLTALAIPTDLGSVAELAFSPDGRTLAAIGIGDIGETGNVFLFPIGPPDDMTRKPQ
jgi:WD40 repeat protein